MMLDYPPPARRLFSLRNFLLVAVVCIVRISHSQMLDLNGNGMSDVWEQLYNAGALDPNGDADGDGVPNLMESLAGTNPFDSNSFPHITAFANTISNFSVTMPCVPGKQYELQSVTNIGGTNWFSEASQIVRAGSTVSLAGTTSANAKFFRIAISDVDSDGDGLNDWEEYQLGLDPFNKFSNGQLDGNGQPMTDYAYAAGKMSVQNVLTISATDPAANEPDPGQAAIDFGLYTVTRGGFPLTAVTVNLGLGGPGSGFATEGVDHSPLPRSLSFPAGMSSQTVKLTPLANTNLMAPVVASLKLLGGTGYSIGANNSAGVVIYPSATPKGTGITGQYFTNSSATYSNSANFNPANLRLTRVDPVIDFLWGSSLTPITNSAGHYTVRWTGQVQPQYSETYYFVANTDDGVKLWINDQIIIDAWTNKSSSDLTGVINLQGGVRYDLKMEYYQSTGSAVAHLSWYSPSQSKQIIPTSRLYPTNVPATPSSVTSPLSAIAFLGQPFSFNVTGANTPNVFTATGLPPGLVFNSTNGAISGVPGIAGDYQVSLTSSNLIGLGASVVDIQVINTGSSVVQEIWSGVPGTNVSDIPTGAPATVTNVIGTLEGTTDYGDNYGERIRGYFTAPVTGNYYFWIAGSDSAELWISNDGEPVNKVKRAWVLPTANSATPPFNGTGSRQWNAQTNQQSKWLSLVAGQPYYLEILHKAGAGANDNWSAGWSLDSLGTNAVPSGIVPGYLLSRYYPLPVTLAPGTLYTANMLALPGISSTAEGSATLRVSADGTQAVLNYSVNGIASTHVDHIYSDPYLNSPSELVYDIAATHPQVDGSYLWTFKPAGSLAVADILEIINENKAAIVIQTPANPAGEIGGHFTLANGSQTFTPPPAPPAWADDHNDTNAAARFLLQATFGPSPSDIALVQYMGYSNWINYQFSLPTNHHLPLVLANPYPDPTQPYLSQLTFDTWWQQSVTAPDQLRQRVAFALSEIMVISENGTLGGYYANSLSSYYDTLLDNSFGNYRALLKAATLHPAMGLYLNMQGNDAGSIITGLHPNENYAREIQQLFSIGLNRMWPDGTLVMNSQSAIVPTYGQNEIMGFASTFTGWNFYQTNQSNGRLPTYWFPSANYTNPMVLVPTHHELGTKLVLDNVMLPAAQGSQSYSTNASFDAYCAQDLEQALDSIFYNQNVGPFICRQLIQRLVTSNPSRGYLYRVVQAFNDNGSGVRGDLQAVIRAILLDYEARSTDMLSVPTYGKQREPLLRVTAPARAFMPPQNITGTYFENGGQTVTVTITNVSAHRLNNNDVVNLSFADTSGQLAPLNQAYSVTVISPTMFNISATGLAGATYGQTNSLITISLSGHGLTTNNWLYLDFNTGTSQSGSFQVQSVLDANHFTVLAANSLTNSGNCLIPKLTANGGFVVTGKTNVTVATVQAHGLSPGNGVYLDFTQAGGPADGLYTVLTVPDANHFTVVVPTISNQTQNGVNVYPQIAPNLVRSGTVTVSWNTWLMNTTDSTVSGNGNLFQTPLRAPTVFNFYYPNYAFPGPLAAAGLTTPEFQLTSDTSVANQMNFLEGGILSDANNTNGLTSFINGGGAIVLDISPWMTTNYTANANVPSLVDSLNSLLLAGQLSTYAKTNIVNYVTNTVNFPFGSTPTKAQMRDRVRATVHLLINSPDYTIQK